MHPIKAPSIGQMILTSLTFSIVPPLLLSAVGHNHWLAYLFAAIAGYSSNAVWRAYQREQVWKHLWVHMSDQYIESIQELEQWEPDGPPSIYTQEWDRLLAQQSKLMRLWHLELATIDDKHRWYEISMNG